MRAAVVGGGPQERERRGRAGRVVRVVQPEDGGPAPRRRIDGVEVGEEAVGLGEREPRHVAAGEPGTSFGDRVARARHRHQVLATVGVEERLGEAEDRLFRTERGEDVGIGIEGDAEASVDPGRDGATELGEARGPWIGRGRLDRILHRLTDERGRLLAGVAHAEVDDGATLGDRGRLPAIQLLERIRLRRSETG